MGDILVLFMALTWGGIKHVTAAPSRLGRTRQNQFLCEAHLQFRAQMSQCMISNMQAAKSASRDLHLGFSAETVR